MMEYRILGPLEVLDGGPPIPLGTLKERAVLAVLLLRANEVVTPERPPVEGRRGGHADA